MTKNRDGSADPHSPDCDVASGAPDDATLRALHEELDRLVQLPTKELLAGLDPHRAGESFSRLMDCQKNIECRIDFHEYRSGLDLTNAIGVQNNYYKHRKLRDSQAKRNPASLEAPINSDLALSDQAVRRLRGRLKWFDIAKGYGFVAPDIGLHDALMHVDCLRKCGVETIYEGSGVLCDVIDEPKGARVLQVLSVDNSSALFRSKYHYRAPVSVKSESSWERAVCKWFNRARGFGFLARAEVVSDRPKTPDTAEIYVSAETLRLSGFIDLAVGQPLQVRWGTGPRGRTAVELRPDKELWRPGLD